MVRFASRARDGLLSSGWSSRFHEADISAEPTTEKAEARLPRADEHAGGSSGAGPPAPAGAPAPHGLTGARPARRRRRPARRPRRRVVAAFASPDQRLRREQRVRKSADFRTVMKLGSRGGSRWVLAFVSPGVRDGGRLGVVASRRVGGAVTRARAKRRLRELYRRGSWRPAGDLVLVARRGIGDAPWPSLEAGYRLALERAGAAGP